MITSVCKTGKLLYHQFLHSKNKFIMRLIANLTILISSFILSACVCKGTNPEDPYESWNREIHKFNMAFDATILKPSAKLYTAVLPIPVRNGINNAYNNVLLLPSTANDLLQGDWRYAIKDAWRFMINSTFGVAGVFDVAEKRFGLPPHYNDLGLTFAKWGDKKSPYIVLPLLGPTTIRDGMAAVFDYLLFTPYPYINNNAVIYPIVGLRYVDLRSHFLDQERLMEQALDKYTFMRDAYLQHRHFLITGEQPDNGSLYVDEAGGDYLEDEPAPAVQAEAS